MQVVPPGRAARPDAASSVAPIALAIGAPCVLASERASHPADERHPANPSSRGFRDADPWKDSVAGRLDFADRPN